MIVQLAADAATVAEADDCTRLHVATKLAADTVGPALRNTGSGRLAEGGTALLDIDVLHARARAAASSPHWDAQWQAMIDYADRKGWLSADGRAVQAHVEELS